MSLPVTTPTAPPSSSVESASTEKWFLDQVHRHDGQLKAYLRCLCPGVRDVDDVVQESYFRVWRHCATRPIRFAKAFLFVTARRLLINLVRHEKVAATDAVEDMHRLAVYDNGRSAADAASRSEMIDLLVDAVDSLPARCRDVVILRKFELLSTRETAERLGIKEASVEMQLSRGNTKIREYLAARGLGTVLGREFE